MHVSARKRAGSYDPTRQLGSDTPPSKAATAIPAVYIVLSLLLGGSSKPGLLSNAVLELVTVLFLLGLALAPWKSNPLRDAPGLTLLFVILAMLVGAHLLPLPPTLWTSLPGREFVVEGYQMLGLSLPSLPLSLDPAGAKSALLALLPAGCAILLILKYGRASYLPVALSVIAVAAVSVLIGIAQLTGGANSPFYFYASATRSGAKAFFANVNHLATLFLICLPLLAASLHELGRGKGDPVRQWVWIPGSVILIVLVFGLFLTSSVGGALLLGPTLLGTIFILPPLSRKLKFGAAAAVLAMVGIAAATVGWSNNASEMSTSLGTDDLDRRGIARMSWEIATGYWPIGSGVGSFERVYQAHEQVDRVSNKYVNHAHNEYLEITIETGLAGLLLLAVFLWWWARKTYRAWRLPASDSHWRQAASMIIGIVAAHSLIDYPARTLAILVLVAAASAILSRNVEKADGASAAQTRCGRRDS